jgi:hypothetical protein
MTVAIGSNNVVVSSSNRAAILPSGILINSSSTFHNLTTIISTSTCPSGSRQVAGYLGLRFPINGQPHYGWALLEVNISQYTINTKLLGFAYETIAGQGIRTGQISGTVSATETLSESNAATVSSRTNEISANTDRGMLRGLDRSKYGMSMQNGIHVRDDDDGDDIDLDGKTYDTTQVENDADEASGASGSPLFAWFGEDNPCVIGVHSGVQEDWTVSGSETWSCAAGTR